MDIHIKLRMNNYPGFLAFLSEYFAEKEQIEAEKRFYAFRYKTQYDKDSDIERVLISFTGYSSSFNDNLFKKINDLKEKGIILGIDNQGWNFDQYVFGEKGLELAKDIFSLGTSFAISMRQKFGKLLEPQNEFPDEVMQRFIAPGAWLLLSNFFNVAGYSSIQEINAYITAIQSRLRFMPEKDAEQVRHMLRLTLDIM